MNPLPRLSQADELDPADADAAPEARTPQVFYMKDDSELILDWVAEGTDGCLYTVPAEPGGWLRRTNYEGSTECLKPLSEPKAASVLWFVYGDYGSVTITRR